MATPHVVLLGDSIFDNAAYVPGEPDIVRQLRRHLPPDWRASLLAADGAVVGSVHAQLPRLPADATHLVLSAGGNDALGHVGILDEPASSSRQTLDRLADIRDAFATAYGRLLEELFGRRLPCAVCTIYEGALSDPGLQRAAATALTVFNDVILRSAFRAGVPVIDLRLVCDSRADYANPIEPSATGGDKIARTIARLVTTDPFTAGRSSVYGLSAPPPARQ